MTVKGATPLRRFLVVITSLALSIVAQAQAGEFGNNIGVGYLANHDGTKIYSESTGPEVELSAPKNFRLIAVSTARAFIGGVLATESESDGRFHVRYYKNGKDKTDGDYTGWVDPKEVTRFSFDCCGDPRCSGIKAGLFQTATYSDCVVQASETAVDKKAAAPHTEVSEIEKLKLQLEIEKLKLEMERLKASCGKNTP